MASSPYSMSHFVINIVPLLLIVCHGKLKCNGVRCVSFPTAILQDIVIYAWFVNRVNMKGQTMAIPLDTCTISQMSDTEIESYTYSCDDDTISWNLWKSKECSGAMKTFPLSAVLEQMNGTLLEFECNKSPCESKIIQNLYEIDSCGVSIDETTKFSQTAAIPGECIVGPTYSVKHKCYKGNSNKVTTNYYSDRGCRKKVKTLTSKCNRRKLLSDKDTCSIEENEQFGVITDNCCLRLNI